MTKNKFCLAVIALFLAFAGSAIVLQTAAAQDKIKYDAVYDCGDGKLKFKVLSCKGTGKFDYCDVFNINEYSPNGGNKGSIYRSQIENDINQGCKIKGRSADKKAAETNKQNEETTAAKTNNNRNNNQNKVEIENKTGVAAACFASDDDSVGKTANEKTFRGVIRRLWEKEAKEGLDGAVTIAFQKFVVGGSRPWRATTTDAYSQADPKKPIYAVRAAFTTCTDYKSAINKRKMERVYDCFVHKSGGWQCTQTGASGALALKDEKQYIQKSQ
jgi:hypothetical protein